MRDCDSPGGLTRVVEQAISAPAGVKNLENFERRLPGTVVERAPLDVAAKRPCVARLSVSDFCF